MIFLKVIFQVWKKMKKMGRKIANVILSKMEMILDAFWSFACRSYIHLEVLC